MMTVRPVRPLTKESRYQVMPDASICRNENADILLLTDVRSAPMER